VFLSRMRDIVVFGAEAIDGGRLEQKQGEG
jgi:hypothetical protein